MEYSEQTQPQTPDDTPSQAIVPASDSRPIYAKAGSGPKGRKLNEVTLTSFSTREMAGKGAFTVDGYTIREGTQYGDLVIMAARLNVVDEAGHAYDLPIEVRSTAGAIKSKLAQIAENDGFPVEVQVKENKGAKGPYYTLE